MDTKIDTLSDIEALPTHTINTEGGASSQSERLSTLARVVVWAALIGGSGVRLLNYYANRSLWLDEASLALNIVGRSFSGLLAPLEYIQAAPVGFLMLEKLSVISLGGSEYSLRLWPLLAGLLALPLFWAVARRTLTPRAAVIGLVFFATSGSLIYFSGEVKQYSSDVLIGLLILWVAAEAPAHRRSGRWLFRLGLVGALGIWFSHPAVFILGGVGLALLGFEQGQRCSRADVAAILCIWGISFLNNYFFITRAVANNASLKRMWADGLIPFPPTSLEDCSRGWLLLNRAFSDPVGLAYPALAAGLAVVGGLALGWSRPRSLALIAGPIVLALAASALGRYPFSGRLILFTVPLFVMLIAAGIDTLCGQANLTRKLFALAITLGLLASPIQTTVRNTMAPRGREELRDVLCEVAPGLGADDVVYVYYGSRQAFLYYQQTFIPSHSQVVFGKRGRQDSSVYDQELLRLKRGQRNIFVFSHNYKIRKVDEEKYIIDKIDRAGTRLDEVHREGASAYVYKLHAPSDDLQDGDGPEAL